MSRRLLLVLIFIRLSSASGAEPELRDRLKDQHAIGADAWIYNDIARGFAEARRTGKPLFVTFRCVPCKACEGFDAEVANGSEIIQDLAGEKFISVRQVEMKGVDLSQFQFDYDLNWAAMFLNADGTVYARYGTQSAEGADAYNSIAGLSNTMRRVLELHENYPNNQEQLTGKRGPDKPYETALEMPGMENTEKLAAATARDNCVHCHNIHDAEQNHLAETGEFTHDALWRFPLPENIGLVINPQSGVRVMKVLPESPAADAGLKTGEVIATMNHQAITSIADIQWALDGLKNEAIAVGITTAAGERYSLTLWPGWKKTDISWRGSIWSLPPRLPVWMEPAEENQRDNAEVDKGTIPLLVKWINAGRPGGKAAKEAGLREGDLIVALNGEPLQFEKSREFVTHVKLTHEVGDEITLTVLGENGTRREVVVTLVE